MPTSTDFDWNDIPLILALARSGSMSATGRQLGVDASTISRRIAAAEKALKLRLFIRDNTGYRLTDAGQVFVEHGEAVYGNVQSMLQASSQEADATAGPVNLTSIDFLFDYWLLEHVPALHAQHPHLQLTLQAENQNLSFTRREADFALRLGKPSDDAALVMRKLGDLGFAVYGHEKFAGTPRACWGTQPWIAYDDALAGTGEMQWLAAMQPSPRKVLKVNSLSTMVRAARAGVGMALLPCLLGRQEGLHRIGATVEVQRDIWLLSHRDAGGIARFKTVSAWLSQAYAANEQLLCGAASPL
ncbi:LysR family transcriptional regulator [Duganella sp. FT94W]|uniref:LysR family transcriptional regulator n=1 Tax=Duganella lactea TaxID=2692173 RepID=A0ABW9V302_9BURK|nr:LysR family transcriptional regulator [Duganella lactea]MYM33160.1 LysR family transcriptional regulator [Duganella lactea]